jgi:hypothetical protein
MMRVLSGYRQCQNLNGRSIDVAKENRRISYNQE